MLVYPYKYKMQFMHNKKGGSEAEQSVHTNMKNTLLITSDQQHYMTLGINNPEIKTPNLDRLAKLGMSFDRAYCPNPTCTPTRASIITGLYPSAHKAWSLGTKLDEQIPTIGSYLQQQKVQTALVGKGHFQQLAKDDGNGNFSSIESIPVLKDLQFWKQYNQPFYGFKDYAMLRNHTNEFLVGQHYGLWLEAKGNSPHWREYYPSQKEYYQPNKYNQKAIEPHHQFPQAMAWDIPLESHYNTFITEKTINYIDKYIANDENFFIWASYPDPHPEYLVPEPYASMYSVDDISIPESYYQQEYMPSQLVAKTREIEPDFSEYKDSQFTLHGCHSHIQDEQSLKEDICKYYAMVTYLDDQIGLLLAHLEKTKQLDNTLIIFTTDHGHYYGQHRLIRKGPFLYEDAIKVPFLVAGGNYKYKQKRSEQLISLVDIFATIAEHMGVLYNHYDVQSKSFLKLLEDDTIKLHNSLTCEFRHEQNSLHLRAYIEQRYKMVLTYDASYGEIYDLENDPNELNNLWENESLKLNLLQKFYWAEVNKECLHMPRLSNA